MMPLPLEESSDSPSNAHPASATRMVAKFDLRVVKSEPKSAPPPASPSATVRMPVSQAVRLLNAAVPTPAIAMPIQLLPAVEAAPMPLVAPPKRGFVTMREIAAACAAVGMMLAGSAVATAVVAIVCFPR